MFRSTDAPTCAKLPAHGGYTVQPVPDPASREEMMKVIVRSLCYLFVVMLYQGPQLLMERISSQTHQLLLALP